MSGSSASWQRGRTFEKKAFRLLQIYFDDVKPIYLEKRKKQRNFDYTAFTKDGKKVNIECKSTLHPQSNITLGMKDLSADYLVIKHGESIYIFKKEAELDYNKIVGGKKR